MLKKKICANFQRIIELFTQKIVTKLSKIWVWDPRSGIRKKPIPVPGVKKAPDPGSGSTTLTIGQINCVGAQVRRWTRLLPPAAGVLLHLQGRQQLVDHQAARSRGPHSPGRVVAKSPFNHSLQI